MPCFHPVTSLLPTVRHAYPTASVPDIKTPQEDGSCRQPDLRPRHNRIMRRAPAPAPAIAGGGRDFSGAVTSPSLGSAGLPSCERISGGTAFSCGAVAQTMLASSLSTASGWSAGTPSPLWGARCSFTYYSIHLHQDATCSATEIAQAGIASCSTASTVAGKEETARLCCEGRMRYLADDGLVLDRRHGLGPEELGVPWKPTGSWLIDRDRRKTAPLAAAPPAAVPCHTGVAS